MQRRQVMIGGAVVAMIVLLAMVRFAPWLRVQLFGTTVETRPCDTSSERPSAWQAPCAAPSVKPANQCGDGIDNDNDTRVDWDDPSCHTGYRQTDASYVAARAEGPDPECVNNRDDDRDGRIDAADAGCYQDKNPARPFVPTNTESGEGVCADGKDNEKDVPDVATQMFVDGDGSIDRADLGCYDLSQIRALLSADSIQIETAQQFYGVVVDNADWYRPNRPTEIGEPGCANFRDDDGDGKIDDQDAGCYQQGTGRYDPFGSETGEEECVNGRDDDADGLTDAKDPGCYKEGHLNGQFSFAENEIGGRPCADGADNDGKVAGVALGDGRIDEGDPGCHLAGNIDFPYLRLRRTEEGEPRCADGIDNNNKNGIDQDDPACHLGGNTDWPYLWFRSER